MTTQGPLIDMEYILNQSPATRPYVGWAGAMSWLMQINTINKRYREAPKTLWEEEGSFFKGCLRGLNIAYQVSTEDLARFPQQGPVVVVSNHPFGVLDALILSALLEEVRPDFRMMGNFILDSIQPARHVLIPVNPFGHAKGSRENAKSLRLCVEWLEKGGVLGTFPAGEVARFNFKHRAVRDPEWNKHAITLARRTGAAIVPIFVQGRNSLMFQSLGQLNPLLRTLMLPREILNKAGKRIPLAIGKPITPSQLDHLESDLERTRYVRMRTEILRNRQPAQDAKIFVIPARQPVQETIIAPIDPDLMEPEVNALEDEYKLVIYKHFTVYLVGPERIPNTLREIGRLREVCFRMEGEGSGKACDLDEFDRHYEHMFLWDHQKHCIAGAYRIGKTDIILPKYGKKGLYTSTLFKFSDEFLEALTPGCEAGRSFVSPEYQKDSHSLLLLWRGLAAIVTRDPRHHLLFGPVSISNTYSKASKTLIARYLREGQDEDLLKLATRVRPRRPFRHKRRIFGLEGEEVSHLLDGVEDVSILVSEIEADRKGIPVLLRHYLTRMHSMLLSFNVDREFCNCLDGLLITDMAKTEARFLAKLMSKEGMIKVAAFMADLEAKKNAKKEKA